MRKVFVVWNPASGGRSSKIVKQLATYLQASSLDYLIADTSKTKSANKTVQDQLDHTFSDLIIVGGDGTINEAVNGLNFDIPVGIIPAGTGDDFVKMISIGKTLKEQMHSVVHGTVSTIDLGVCNERKFVNGIGIGFDGQIVEDMIAKRVPLLSGHAAYYYHVLRILGGYSEKRFRYRLDDLQLENELILLTIGNGSTFGGGFKLMPQAKIDDGLLEICEIGKLSGLRRFLNIHKLSIGTHDTLSTVKFHQAQKILVEENPLLFAHIDGERLGNPPFDIQVLPKALKLRSRTNLEYL